MTKAQTSILLTTLSFLCACNDSPSGPNGYVDFYPLRVGNRWEYKIQRYDSTGAAIGSSEFTEAAISDTIISGEKWYEYVPLEDYVLLFAKYYYTNKSDGLYIWISGSTSPQLYYKYPAQANEAYNYRTDSVTIVSINEAVQTLAGKFNCIVYQQHYNASIYYTNTFVSPGVGKVKTEAFYYSPQMDKRIYESIELYNYTLK